MMNKTRTSRYHLLKFVMFVPMIVFLLIAFRNRKEVEPNAPNINSLSAETFTLSSLTYSIPDIKVKALVFKEQDKCLLKPGGVFNLTMVSNEKNRLKNLLERNGFKRLNSNAITFLIDSSSADKSFSVQVNINAGASVVSNGRKELVPFNREIAQFNYNHSSCPERVVKANIIRLSVLNNQAEEFLIHSNLSNSKTTFSI
ncbi:MAG: hypothetical protein WKG06_47050 [Segetibacter sp.]